MFCFYTVKLLKISELCKFFALKKCRVLLFFFGFALLNFLQFGVVGYGQIFVKSGAADVEAVAYVVLVDVLVEQAAVGVFEINLVHLAHALQKVFFGVGHTEWKMEN